MNALLIDGIVAIMEKKMDLLILILAQRSIYNMTTPTLHSSATKTKQLIVINKEFISGKYAVCIQHNRGG